MPLIHAPDVIRRRCRRVERASHHEAEVAGAGRCDQPRINIVGEVCDDGNAADLDGCSSNCKSSELCGNGVTDSTTGEVCDDKNLQDGDGCSANCRSNESCGNRTVDSIKGEVIIRNGDSSRTMSSDSIITFNTFLNRARMIHPDPNSRIGDSLYERLITAFYRPTIVLDRERFKSLYIRDPDGHIVEIATDLPGFDPA